GKLIISVPSNSFYIQYSVNDILNFPPHHSSRYPDEFFYKIQKIFNIKLVSIKHQILEPIHKAVYLKAVIYTKILKLMGRDFKRIDNRKSTRLIEKVSYG